MTLAAVGRGRPDLGEFFRASPTPSVHSITPLLVESDLGCKNKSPSSGCLNDKCAKRSRLGVQNRAELSGELIQSQTQGGSSGTYVLHRTGRTQENNQLLHQAWGRRSACRRQDRRTATGAGHLAGPVAATVDRGTGSHAVHRLDLRLPEAARPRFAS